MSSQTKHPVPPPQETGFRIFVRASYAAQYNFAVENYNAVSVANKRSMRGGRLLLFRAVIAVAWIIALVFALLALFRGPFAVVPCILGIFYIALSAYNLFVYIDNRTLLNATRLLRANVAGPSGLNHEWVTVPLDSRSANERLAAVEQSLIDNVRQEFVGSKQGEMDCMVYTKRYADTYTSFPKELILHVLAFLVVITVAIILAAV